MKHSGRIKMLMILLLAGGIAVALIRPGRLYSLFILAGIGAVVVIFSIFELYSFYLPLQAAEDTLQNGENPKEVLGEIVDSAPDNPVGSLIRGIVQQSRADQDAEYYAKQIELTALQSQINPHFLYNSLDTIRGQALIDGNREVAEMIKTLSSFFRYSISRKGEAVTLRDELENIRNYMKIQQYRFGDRFRLEIDIDEPEVLDYYIPRLIFQPIAENAIVHGLKDTLKGGIVSISVDATDDLIVVISDNGKGMSLDELDSLNRRIHAMEPERAEDTSDNGLHTGIALINVHRRIELLYGAPYGVNVYSSANRGTDVELVLPIRKLEEEQ